MVLLLLVSCAARPPAAPAARDAWANATWEERHDTMTWLVLPNMAQEFQRRGETASPELTCRTCHGQDAERVNYKLPSGLVALDPKHLPDDRSPDPRVARTARFMRDEVVQRMQTMLQSPSLGCFTCHPRAT